VVSPPDHRARATHHRIPRPVAPGHLAETPPQCSPSTATPGSSDTIASPAGDGQAFPEMSKTGDGCRSVEPLRGLGPRTPRYTGLRCAPTGVSLPSLRSVGHTGPARPPWTASELDHYSWTRLRDPLAPKFQVVVSARRRAASALPATTLGPAAKVMVRSGGTLRSIRCSVGVRTVRTTRIVGVGSGCWSPGRTSD
jgi:hypothetical protein